MINKARSKIFTSSKWGLSRLEGLIGNVFNKVQNSDFSSQGPPGPGLFAELMVFVNWTEFCDQSWRTQHVPVWFCLTVTFPISKYVKIFDGVAQGLLKSLDWSRKGIISSYSTRVARLLGQTNELIESAVPSLVCFCCFLVSECFLNFFRFLGIWSKRIHLFGAVLP